MQPRAIRHACAEPYGAAWEETVTTRAVALPFSRSRSRLVTRSDCWWRMTRVGGEPLAGQVAGCWSQAEDQAQRGVNLAQFIEAEVPGRLT